MHGLGRDRPQCRLLRRVSGWEEARENVEACALWAG